MSTKFKFELATQKEDGALRAILKQTAMPGNIELSFQREPNFFLAESAGNTSSQVIVARDQQTQSLVGFGCRSFRSVFIDGQVRTVGYLSALRGLPEVRKGTLLARAYRFLKTLDQDNQVPYSLTTIFDDNQLAKDTLTSGRAGLPVYESRGGLKTFFLPLYRRKKAKARRVSTTLVSAEVSDFDVHGLITEFGKRHQFGPVYAVDDLMARTRLLPGFNPNHLHVYRRGHDITATMGVWDQSCFKQSVVSGYSPLYRLFRPFSNVGSRLGWTPRLPSIGGSFPYLYACALGYRMGAEEDFLLLLKEVMDIWTDQGYTYLLLGLHQSSPLLESLAKLAVMHLDSTLYVVYWPDHLSDPLPQCGGATHIEIATL